MHCQIKTSFLFCTFTLFVCLSSFFIGNSTAQVDDGSVVTTGGSDYTFDSIDVPGVEFLAVTSSSDFEDYAGYTRSTDGEKEVAFTLIDGVFTTYDYPGSQNTYFYALANNGQAAGYYQDSDGLHHGVILENGELQQFDFPDAVQTEIWGISDATGALTGNYTDDSGIRRGFTGDEIIEFPGASETYADFVNASGGMVGSYVDAEGLYHPYVRTPEGRLVSLDLPGAARLEFYFVHGINDARVVVSRAKPRGSVPGTFVGTFQQGLEQFKVPGSVSTEGYNINQDGSIVGHYDSADGRRHGFIARPAQDTVAEVTPTSFNYTFESIDVPGVEFLAVTASSDFDDYAGYTRSADGEKEVAFTLIDGAFTTYDYPDSQNTYFYALGNSGQAAGHYQDSDGLYHGIILEDGELRQYDFPGAVQTEIFGISDATGALTGNYIDESGIRRGFSGDTIVEAPGATQTYADFVNASGRMVGSYIDAEGIYHPYVRSPDGRFISLDLPQAATFEYFFVHGINDAGTFVGRFKRVGVVPRTSVGSLQHGLEELKVPGSVSTEGYNINQDGSIVGHYDSADGSRHGFIARPAPVVEIKPIVAPADSKYTFESIDVTGAEFLAVTASSDFEDYAGYIRSADGEKEVAFTLIDGVFTTHDYPGSQKTHFYALDNNGRAAGHYLDSDGLYHGVILEDGELRQYDFPNAVQTEIYGISDATGALTGNWIDASGVRRGFSGDTIVEYPGALETHAHFAIEGSIVGSYVDAEGIYHLYTRIPDGRFTSIALPQTVPFEYFFMYAINDSGIYVAQAKAVGDVPRAYVGTLQGGPQELQVPGSVSTAGWNINQDSSIVGHYDSADGRRHGFIARPAAPVDDEPVATPTEFNYTFESIDVPGVEFLELTASSDFEDYAGNTRSADGEKIVAFTLIDGVFTTYDYPGSKNTYFYALGNSGQAAGYYEDSRGLHHGVVLDNGELRQYDFPGAVQTEIFGISDTTGALTGNYIDASGIRRGFSAETIVEFPGAPETYADFVNASGHMVGSFIDAEGRHHVYIRDPDGKFTSFAFPEVNLDYLFVHGINDAGIYVARVKAVGDIPRTHVAGIHRGLQELQFPGSVSTEGWNINQDGSVVGNYVSTDGRRHGFIARPTTGAVSDLFGNTYHVTLDKGLNMISVPLAPPTPLNAKTLAALTGATTVIAFDEANQEFVGWTPNAPDAGFPIEGGKGYIVNVPQARQFAYVGSRWTNQTENAAAAPAISVETSQEQEVWAFVVSGHLEGKPAFDGYQVTVRNRRTDSTITASVRGDYFAAATADLARRSVVQAGDVIEVRVTGPGGNVESDTFTSIVTPEDLANAVLSIRLDSVGQPKLTQLLQNFPNPFNPETWIPYQLETAADATLQIYDTSGGIVRTLDLGFKQRGFYMTRATAAYWDGRNNIGEQVASGVYFYSLSTSDFSATRKMLILK